MKIKSLYLLLAVLGLSFAVGLSACGKKKDADDIGGGGDDKTASTTAAPTGDATITGTVAFEGAAPAATPAKMESDPVCAKSPDAGAELTQEVAVKDGKLANVFVYVSKGLEGKTFPAPSDKVVLDQQGCRYHPHVVGVMVGQTLTIKNSDPTMHNVHSASTANASFNIAQPTAGATNDKTFDKEEIMIPISCDIHGWMRTYVGVVSNPFFGVSDASGAFSLKNLPAGTYTLTAWHEKLGKQEQQVTVGAKESKAVTFTFKAQ